MSNPDPPVIIPAPILPLLFALSDCVCTELTETGAGPTCWCGIYPGAQVSLEFCSECGNDKCGMGWIRVAFANPSETFPQAIVDPTCRKPLAYQIEVGAARCLPISADGELQTVEQMNMAAAEQMQDAWALFRAIMCCGAPSVAVQQWQPIGPAGGCLGGVWTAWIGTD